VGATVATGAVVAAAAGTAVGLVVDDEAGVAVADDPQAKIAASRIVKDPRIIAFGCFNQWFKMDVPPI